MGVVLLELISATVDGCGLLELTSAMVAGCGFAGVD